MAETTPPRSDTPTLGPTLGVAYVGLTVAAMLYGASNVQIYVYYKTFQDDNVYRKCAVAHLWVLNTLHMVLTIFELWHHLIDSFGNYTVVLSVSWSQKLEVALTIIIVLTVQSLYTLRIWKLSERRGLWPWVVSVALLGGYGTGITVVIKAYSIASFLEVYQIRRTIYFSYALSTFNDFILAFAICHLLSQKKTTTLFIGTKSKVVAVMRYVVISGALTSVCSLAGLVTFCIMPDNLIYFSLLFLLTRVYVNSYLSMLNARRGPMWEPGLPNSSAMSNRVWSGDVGSGRTSRLRSETGVESVDKSGASPMD